MRLGLVGVTYPFRGGIANHTTLLCRALRRDHEVLFVSLRRQYPKSLFPGRTQYDESDKGLAEANEPLIDSLNPLSWRRAARRLAEFRPDAVVIVWWHSFFAPLCRVISGYLARRGIRSYFLCHNVLPHEPNRLDRLLLRFAFARAAGFLLHSEFVRRELLTLRPKARTAVSPHPIYDFFVPDRPRDTAACKGEIGLADRRVVLFFGLVRRYKGLGVLLDALLALPPEAGYRLLVVGEFYDDPARYRERMDALRARGQLLLVDRFVRNEAVGDYFCAADVVVAPYLSASQSGVIQLAYAFDKPVITTDVGGLAEMVVEGRTGYVVPGGDSAALARAIADYFEQSDRRALEQAIRAERRRYTWAALAAAVERLASPP